MAELDFKKFLCDFIGHKSEIGKIVDLKDEGVSVATLDKIIRVIGEQIRYAIGEQGFKYKDGEIVEVSDIHNFDDLPRDEQLKWYICIKSVPHNDGGFMPLFCEGEHATLEKIKGYIPDIDVDFFAEHFRKVTESDIDTKPQRFNNIVLSGFPQGIKITVYNGGKEDYVFHISNERAMELLTELQCYRNVFDNTNK